MNNLIDEVKKLSGLEIEHPGLVSRPLLRFIGDWLNPIANGEKSTLHLTKLRAALEEGLNVDFTGTKWESEWLANDKVCDCKACKIARNCISRLDELCTAKSEPFTISPLDAETRPSVFEMAAKSWGTAVIVAHGELYDLSVITCFVALGGNDVIGYCFYRIDGCDCEILALEAIRQNNGIGSALIDAVKEQAWQANCNRLYLETTNDNCHAFRFYQRRGFDISAVRLNALDRSRELKPSIPPTGDDGIPIQYEIEFSMPL
jgi:GNAT superfamily N-acetyltransferase